jgi:hypothetical protein
VPIHSLALWQYHPFNPRRPALVGRLTNDLVYMRLAPGVLEELKQREPRIPATGRRKHKLLRIMAAPIVIPKHKKAK